MTLCDLCGESFYAAAQRRSRDSSLVRNSSDLSLRDRCNSADFSGRNFPDVGKVFSLWTGTRRTNHDPDRKRSLRNRRLGIVQAAELGSLERDADHRVQPRSARTKDFDGRVRRSSSLVWIADGIARSSSLVSSASTKRARRVHSKAQITTETRSHRETNLCNSPRLCVSVVRLSVWPSPVLSRRRAC